MRLYYSPSVALQARNKKLPHVKVTISLRGIHMLDLSTEETSMEVSIYRFVPPLSSSRIRIFSC